MKSKELANEICNALFALNYRSSNYDYPVISRDHKAVVANAVLAVLNDNLVQQAAEYEAKIFVYEEIIKKSTFAPLISQKGEPQDESV